MPIGRAQCPVRIPPAGCAAGETAPRELPVQKVSREGLSEQIVEQLQDLVFDKHLRSGNRLPGERELCEQSRRPWLNAASW